MTREMSISSNDNNNTSIPEIPHSVSLSLSTEIKEKDKNATTIPRSKPSAQVSENSTLESNCVGETQSLMLGVDIFEESDLEGDVSTRLRFYSSDVDTQTTEKIQPSSPKEKVLKKRKTNADNTSTRLSLQDRIRCIRLCSRYDSVADAQKAWRQTYGTEPPGRKTLTALNAKFQRTGSVADLCRTGRPKSTRNEATVARVEEAIRKDPNKSIRTLARELGVSQAGVHRIKREYEDNRNAAKIEIKKLKDQLKDASKRIAFLEKDRRLATQSNVENCRITRLKPDSSQITESDEIGTIVFTDGIPLTGDGGTSVLASPLAARGESNLPGILSSQGHVSVPSLLRMHQQGHHDTIHIITLPQGAQATDH